VACGRAESSKSSEDQAFTPRIDMVRSLGRELVSKTAAIGVPSTEGGGKGTKEGK
jgi:hypothetical protein